MDAVAGLLDGPRARDAFLLRSSMSAPWSLRIRDEAPLTVMAVVRGRTFLDAENLQLSMSAGDVAVLKGPWPYTVADPPRREPDAVINPDQRCSAPDGGSQSVFGDVGIRTWGNSAHGETELLTGTYTVSRAVSQRLLQALPPALVLAAHEWDCPYVDLLAAEIGRDEPGQEAVLDRVLDLLLVAALRAYLDRSPAPSWYRAYDDPVVGAAVRLLQHAPDRAWTLPRLAAEVGVARSTLARRFAELVGEPPMAFLTGWRISLAADLLRESDATLEAVARQVGYGSAFALSAAFKRERGVSPKQYRAAS